MSTDPKQESIAYQGAWVDCIQDGCENNPFASIGGPSCRDNFKMPKRDYVVTEQDRADWLRGYADSARHQYGADWNTCEFQWSKALDGADAYCHNLGQWHAVPWAVILLVQESIGREDYSEVKYTTPGGNTVFAQPVLEEGRVIRIDFCTDPGD